MRLRRWVGLAFGCVLALAAPARADVWDIQTDSDNGPGTDNQFVHGLNQAHDLAAQAGPTADEDWYWLTVPEFTSFEIVVDATSGDIGGPTGVSFNAVDNTGAVLFPSVPVDGSEFSRAIRNFTGSGPDFAYILVEGACGTTCNADDVYHIRYYDTTYSIPRFNNSSTQITILQIQNTTVDTVDVDVNFFSTTGALLGTSSGTIAAHGLLVLNSSTLGFAAGTSGSIIVTHTGRYGALTGKAVALEPATGFTFDTLMLPRPL